MGNDKKEYVSPSMVFSFYPESIYIERDIETGEILNKDKDPDNYIDSFIERKDGLYACVTNNKIYEKKSSVIEDEGIIIEKYENITKYIDEIDKGKMDPLMKIYRREVMDKEIKSYLEECRFTGNPFTIAMMDLDGFKSINDEFGHQSGDDVLKGFASHLKKNTRQTVDLLTLEEPRSTDGIYRWGGEEIIVLLKNITEKDSVKRLDEIRQIQSEKTYNLKGTSRQITFTTGFVNIPEGSLIPMTEDGKESLIDSLIDMADTALYDGKHSGKNVVVNYRDVSPYIKVKK